MINKIFIWIASLTLAMTVVTCPFPAEAREPLMVFAAASLSNALKELAVEFEKEYKVEVVFNFSGSSALRLQIENGSPCDVFLAADKFSNERLSAKNLIDDKNMVNFLSNRLVVVAHANTPDRLNSLYDIHLAAGDHMAIADSKIAPAGIYATQALTRADLFKKIEPFLVPAMDVRAALALVQSGNAKYAIVYATDAMIAPDVKKVYIIPGKLHDPIVYSAAVIKNDVNTVPARNFLSFLLSPSSKMIFTKYGFESF